MSNKASLNELKARALIAGFMRDSIVNARPAGSLADAAVEFAALLAMVTSADRQHRSDAKKRIKELATAGGWSWTSPVLGVSSQSDAAESADTPAPAKRKAGTWSNEEKKLVVERWLSPGHPKNGLAVTELCGATGRSGLAIIIRLFQESLVNLKEGDELCRQMKLDRLLSETNVAGNQST